MPMVQCKMRAKKILAWVRVSLPIGHRPIGRKGASCERIKHIFTFRSQRLMQLL